MLANTLFTLIPRLLNSRWFQDFQAHHAPCEESLSARLGPVQIESNHVFVLDHEDVYLGLRLPTLHRRSGRWQWGHLTLGYRACKGTEQIRSSGLESLWLRPVVTNFHTEKPSANKFPF